MRPPTQDSPPRRHPAPPWAIILTACAIVTTAHLLGVASLTHRSLGVPVGLWIVLALATAWYALELRFARTSVSPSAPSALVSGRLSFAAEALTRTLAPIAELISLAAHAAIAAAPFDRLRSADPESLANALHDKARWPTRPLRIGLDLSDADAAAITAAATPGTRWFRVADGTDLMARCRRSRLDAVVSRHAQGPIRIVTNERSGRDAARLDWAAEETPSLAAVFPHRIDTQGVTIDAEGPLDAQTGPTVRDIAECAAALARHPARLGLPDRLFGRRPIHDASPFVLALAERLDTTPVAGRIIARVVSARAVSDAPPLVERCAARAPSDPAVQLRLAAVRFAAGDDVPALSALMHADRLLRSGDPPARLDHAAFVESELRCGEDAPITLGRVAVGICLLCASTPVDRLRFIRDDLDEEMRFAPWLIGRDQDRRLLLEIFRELDRCRRADELGLPAAA